MTHLQTPAGRLLLWSVAGAVLAQAMIWSIGAAGPPKFSAIFTYLMTAYDSHGNLLLVAIAACAFFLRGRPEALAVVRLAGERPWQVAAAAFLLLCAGSRLAYQGFPLAMDEYATAFQAQVFAAGQLAGKLPAELLDELIPRGFQNHFFVASRATGEVTASYWPGFALILAPFTALGIPWAANPAIGALTLPLIHRLARQLTGSTEAAGWALLLAAASPAFVVNAMSFYAMPALLLCNLLYASLLLQPTVARALLAGVIGSFALVTHNPVPHLLFAAAFAVWLCFRPGAAALLAALAVGYAPLSLLLGLGWHHHLQDVVRATVASPVAATPPPAADAAAASAAAAQRPLLEAIALQLASAVSIPDARVLQARLAGLSKLWTWGAAGLMVIAAWGYWAARRQSTVRVLAAALAVTYFGYFLVPFDQGHGWGYRYAHPAWFILPVLAAIALADAGEELRRMAAIAAVLSLVLASGLRVAQVEGFISGQRLQVPPLARDARADRPEVVFVNLQVARYAGDLVRNDPFLRGPRVTMVYESEQRSAAVMAARYPDYRRSAQGQWGEQWTPARANPAN